MTETLRKKDIIYITCICALISAFIFFNNKYWHMEISPLRYVDSKDEYIKKIETMLSEVVTDITKIRMLNTSDPIDFKIMSMDWVKENWGRKSTEAEIEEVKLEEEIYRALYLIPENFSLVDVKVKQAGTIMAAVAGGSLYIVRDYFNPDDYEGARELLAHEISHIVQGTNFKIEEPSEFDAKQAKNALIEGDAEFTKELYVKYKFNRSVEPSFYLPSGNGTLRDIDALWQLWVAPGIYGHEFVKALHEAGGWNAVNKAYNIIPTSTEEIMHPKKYLMGEVSSPIELDSVEGWNLMRSDRLGEHFIMIILARHIPIEKAKIAAEGWVGDRFVYYKRNGDYLFLWKIIWDSHTDEDEFLSAVRDMLKSIGGEEIAPDYYRTYYGYMMLRVGDLSVTLMGSSKPDPQMFSQQ